MSGTNSIIIDYCSKCDCGQKRPIVNKTHYLCAQKNRERLDKQKENKIIKHKVLKKNIVKTKKKINKLQSVYDEIAQERPHICEGCGTSNSLTHSHTISRARRKDLETDKENIKYLCLKCHIKWEHGSLKEKQELFSFNDMMTYIKRKDKQYYNLLKTKWGIE